MPYLLTGGAARRSSVTEPVSPKYTDPARRPAATVLRFDPRLAQQGRDAAAGGFPAHKLDGPDAHAVQITPVEGVSRRSKAWGGVRVEILQSVSHERLEFRFHAPCHLLLVYEEGLREAGESRVGNLSCSALRTLRHKLTFVPADHEFREYHSPPIRTRAICFYFDPTKMPIDQCAAPESPLSPRLFFERNMLWETAVTLGAAIENGQENEHYCEALAVVIAHEVLRSQRTVRHHRAPVRGGLAPWQQRTVAAYIEKHLTESIPLAALAKLVNLSPYYFCRSFKQSFGVPPHRYHLGRRIERARALLSNPAESVTGIALELGFSETSSFTAAFRNAVGIPPTEYRRTLA